LLLLVQQLEFSWTFRLTLHSCTTLKANQFFTPVQVYKTKYLYEWQYSHHQFIDFINTYGMLRSLYKNTSLPAILVRSLLLKLIIVMQLSLALLLQKY